ncbi:MAG: HAD-IA family hydrolase [Pseudomonadota bacterium]
MKNSDPLLSRTLIDLFIFDLDGTLIDSSRDIANAVNHALGRVGLPAWPLETVRLSIGNGTRILVQKAVQGHEECFEDAFRIFSDYYGRHLLDHTRLYPGVARTLERLRAFKLAVLSNKRQIYCDPIIDGLRLRKIFSCVLGGDVLPQKKPDPAPILYILKKLDVEPRRAVMVGDSPVDVAAGRAAGTHTIGLTDGFSPSQEIVQARPDLTIGNVTEIDRYIG